jgi:TetR/AcrR family transcriptional regulator, mexCD-oprJ operon repressor
VRQQCLVSSTLSFIMDSSSSRLRTPAAILETAARLLAERRDASMNDIAAAGGVGRATLYRYFPTREALLNALADTALEELAGRIATAGLDQVPVPEALQRFLRAVLAAGDRYVVLLDEGTGRAGRDTADHAHQDVVAPMQSLFRRGHDDGTFRPDVDAAVLVELFGALVLAAINTSLPRTLGVEQAAALTGSVFLDGARHHHPS